MAGLYLCCLPECFGGAFKYISDVFLWKSRFKRTLNYSGLFGLHTNNKNFENTDNAKIDAYFIYKL